MPIVKGSGKLGRWKTVACLASIASLGILAALWWIIFPCETPPGVPPPEVHSQEKTNPDPLPIVLASFPKLTVWWDQLDPKLQKATLNTGPEGNIHPSDYIGAKACQKCHLANYQGWSGHPHRWMNAKATSQTVLGDFSGKEVLSYLGGKAQFETVQGVCQMRLERGGVKRIYEVHQTIGSRSHQYYVGTQIDGPEPKEHDFYTKDHVLPFGYWLASKEWVPVVHIGPELPDGERPDPFNPPSKGRHFAEYATSCNHCHTTFALGDLFGRRPQQVTEHAPFKMHWSIKPYLDQNYPDESPKMAELLQKGHGGTNPMAAWDAPHYAVALGISCEACHLGAKAHAESEGKIAPDFVPKSPFLSMEVREDASGLPQKPQPGRTHDNSNWICSRCHSGSRPTFEAGMSTWNSVEYSDAIKGSCYSQLKCVDCHNPHQPIGLKWKQTPTMDDAACLKCHQHFKEAPKRQAHTRHIGGSEGDRCQNCHMPKIHEGLEEVVRTHMIFSPTRPDMIYANQPNACNVCHADKPIDWTLNYLKEWYGKTYEDWRIDLRYPNRKGAVAKGWLESDNPSVRLIGAISLIKTANPAFLPDAKKALDDPYLINRQFAMKALDEVFHLKSVLLGYRFYQSKTERSEPLKRFDEWIQKEKAPKVP